jgi:hypothetical protein
MPSFALHIGDFGTCDVIVVKAYHTFAVSSSPLSYAILDRSRPGQAAVLQDENGMPTLIHFADTAGDAEIWLKAHPHSNAPVVPVVIPEPRTFAYLQDPGHGWLIVTKADLVSAGMSSADVTVCSYVLEDTFALEEDCDRPRFLKHLDERSIPYRIQEQHTNADGYVRCWACNSNPVAPKG